MPMQVRRPVESPPPLVVAREKWRAEAIAARATRAGSRRDKLRYFIHTYYLQLARAIQNVYPLHQNVEFY
jgi:hypothetical protein